MPRALILISTTCPWREVESRLATLQQSDEVIARTSAVIETWCASMGNADYSVRAFGITLESLRLLSAELRDALQRTTSMPSSSGEPPDRAPEQTTFLATTTSIVGASTLDRVPPHLTLRLGDVMWKSTELSLVGAQQASDHFQRARFIRRVAVLDNVLAHLSTLTTLSKADDATEPLVKAFKDYRKAIVSDPAIWTFIDTALTSLTFNTAGGAAALRGTQPSGSDPSVV